MIVVLSYCPSMTDVMTYACTLLANRDNVHKRMSIQLRKFELLNKRDVIGKNKQLQCCVDLHRRFILTAMKPIYWFTVAG